MLNAPRGTLLTDSVWESLDGDGGGGDGGGGPRDPIALVADLLALLVALVRFQQSAVASPEDERLGMEALAPQGKASLGPGGTTGALFTCLMDDMESLTVSSPKGTAHPSVQSLKRPSLQSPKGKASVGGGGGGGGGRRAASVSSPTGSDGGRGKGLSHSIASSHSSGHRWEKGRKRGRIVVNSPFFLLNQGGPDLKFEKHMHVHRRDASNILTCAHVSLHLLNTKKR